MLGWARGGVAKIVQAHTHAPWLPHPCPGLSQAPANGKRFLEAGGGLRRASPSTGLMESLQAILAQFSHNAASPAQAARGRVIEGHSFLLSRSHGPRPGAPRPKQADLARAPSPGSGLTVLSQCAPAQLMRLDCDGQCDPNNYRHTPHSHFNRFCLWPSPCFQRRVKQDGFLFLFSSHRVESLSPICWGVGCLNTPPSAAVCSALPKSSPSPDCRPLFESTVTS